MKYLQELSWEQAKRHGNFTKATKLLMREIKNNLDRITAYHTEHETISELYHSFSYVFGMTSIPEAIFNKIQDARNQIIEIINTL